MVLVCNLSVRERVSAGHHLWLHSEFEARLLDMRPCVNSLLTVFRKEFILKLYNVDC